MADKTVINRRDFIKTATAAGAGLVIAFHLPFRSRLQAASVGLQSSFAPNAWIIVQPDNQVIFRVTKSEMGQGVWTSLPMIIAETEEHFAGLRKKETVHREWGYQKIRSVIHSVLQFIVSIFSDLDRYRPTRRGAD